MFRRLRGINFIIIVLLALGLAGCGDDTTTSTDTGDTISNDSSIAFTGKVVDPLGNPLSGVSIELISDTKQTDTTDANGNWLINVDLGEIKASPGGGSAEAAAAAEALQDNPDQLIRNYPIEISKTGFPTYRYEAAFNATIGYTDGSGAVVLLSKTGNVQPTTILHPYVDNFEFTVYAGLDTAPGAVVTLRAVGDVAGDLGANAGSVSGNRYEIDTKMFKADEEGVIKVTKDDKLPANRNYTVFAAPYDSDGDGVYEYDSSVATQPAGGFNLNVANVAGALIHYELDADGNSVITQTEFAPSVLLTDVRSDIVVTYLNIQNVQNIPVEQADAFEIVVMFNRPVTVQELAAIGGPLFTLTGRGGVTIPFSQVPTGNHYFYTLTPDSTLTPGNNPYIFTITANLLGSSGGFGAGFAQVFNIYEPNAAMYASITPGVDINDNTSYKVDWDDILLGLPYADAGMIPDLNMSWAVSAGATGYEVWVKDSNTPWQKSPDVDWTYNDGQYIEANIDLEDFGALFDAFDPDDVFGLGDIEPFFAGNTLRVVVMPQNANGFATNPNTIAPDDATFIPLTLADNWGPEIRKDDGWNPADANTGFDANTRYDDTEVNIQVDEPLQDATLTGEYGTDEDGARAVTGSYFTVADAYWPDLDLAIDAEGAGTAYPSNRGYILVDLDPTVTTELTENVDIDGKDPEVIHVTMSTMVNFAIRDFVSASAANDAGRINGFDYTAATFTLSATFDDDVDRGSTVYWRGPIQNGNDNVAGTVVGVDYNRVYVLDDTDFAQASTYLTSPCRTRFVSGGANILTLVERPTSAFDSGQAVAGYKAADTGLTINDAINAAFDDDEIEVFGADGVIEEDDILVFDFGDDLIEAEVEDVEAGTGPAGGDLVTLDEEADDLELEDGMTIHIRGDAISTTAVCGYPTVGLSTTAGIQPNTPIAFTEAGADPETGSASVTGVYLSRAVINAILEDADGDPITFAGGSFTTTGTARTPDALQVNLIDRSDNDSGDTDDQIGYEEVGGAFDVF